MNAHEHQVKRRKRKDEIGPSRIPETKESKRRETEKVIVEEKSNQKATSTFKLASNIKTAMDMTKMLETRILNSTVELTFKELSGIMTKIHKVIIDVIRRKRHVIDEVEGVKAVKMKMRIWKLHYYLE